MLKIHASCQGFRYFLPCRRTICKKSDSSIFKQAIAKTKSNKINPLTGCGVSFAGNRIFSASQKACRHPALRPSKGGAFSPKRLFSFCLAAPYSCFFINSRHFSHNRVEGKTNDFQGKLLFYAFCKGLLFKIPGRKAFLGGHSFKPICRQAPFYLQKPVVSVSYFIRFPQPYFLCAVQARPAHIFPAL